MDERAARGSYLSPLYCSADLELYGPTEVPRRWDLGYLGTYGWDRQPVLERLLLEPARRFPEGRFAVAGPQYPDHLVWPGNVSRTVHLSPREHRSFYCAQRFTLNVTRADMVRAGWSPSVRLFEAAACGAPIVSDVWEGLDTILAPGAEILLADNPADVLAALRLSDPDRAAIAAAARARILAEHTADRRAAELEAHLSEASTARAPIAAVR